MIILTTAPPMHTAPAAPDTQAILFRGYLPVLEDIGSVIIVRCTAEIDPLFHQYRAKGEDVVFVSFTHPAEAPRDLDCPTACIFSWARDSLPDTPLHALPEASASPGWQDVLSGIEGIITPRQHLADLLTGRSLSGCQVFSVPFPISERFHEHAPVEGWAGLRGQQCLQLTDVAFDTSRLRLRPENFARPPLTETQRITRALWKDWKKEIRLPRVTPQAPTPAPAQRHTRKSVTLSGIVFTSVLNPLDQTQNWPDIASAFCWAFRDQEDATLILNMTHPVLEHYQEQILPHLALSSPFRCRIIVLHGPRTEDEYLQLIQASHYYVHASPSDALCPSMMEFLSCGKPAIAANHTAARDFLHQDSSLILSGCQQPAPWPDDPAKRLLTFEYRLNWQSLVDAYHSAYALAMHGDYQTMSKNARTRMEKYCARKQVAERLSTALTQVSSRATRALGDMPS